MHHFQNNRYVEQNLKDITNNLVSYWQTVLYYTMISSKILIIDDEPDFSSLLKANLNETREFVVQDINDSALAVRVAKKFQPDLCIIDVVMPGMDGGDVVARFSNELELKDIPVIMLTALVEENPDSSVGETHTGGLPFISKTSDFQTILACIRKHLRENAIE